MATTNNHKAAPTNEEAVQISESFVQKNMKTIIVAVLALVIIIAGILVYNEYVSKPQETKASTAIAKAQELFQNSKYELALNGDSLGTQGFIAIAEEYSGTDAANLANLYAGLCCANLNRWEEAKTYIESFDDMGDQMISPAAKGALGNVYAHLEQLDKAVETLIDAANAADNNTLSPEFLIQAGQILESQNKNAEALKLYETIKEKYVHSPRYGEALQLIERASLK